MRENLNLKGGVEKLRTLYELQKNYQYKRDEYLRVKNKYSIKLFELYKQYKKKNEINLEEMKREIEFDMISPKQEEKLLQSYLKRMQKDIHQISNNYDDYLKYHNKK